MARYARLALLVLLALCAGGLAIAPRTASAEDAVVDVAIFYDALEPHGTWMYVTPYGWVWQPDGVDVTWRPYVDGGTWIWVEGYGWTWFSQYEWGWAPFHYGRWFFHAAYGWLWQPGEVWAPAWVGWRIGPGWVGWIPLPPEVQYRDRFVWTVDVSQPHYAHWWSFVPLRSFTDTRLASHVQPLGWNSLLLRRTRDATRFERDASRFVVNRSFDVADVERAGARVTRRTLRDAAQPTASKAEGDAIVVFRPRVREGKATRQPKAGPRPDARRIAERRERLERMLEEQQKAADAKAPEGIPPEEVERSREERRAAFEAQKKRMAEEAKRAEEQPDAPVAPPTDGPAPRSPEDRPATPDRPDQPGRPDRPTPPDVPDEPDRPKPPPRPPQQPPPDQPPRPPEQPPKDPPRQPPPQDPPGMGDDRPGMGDDGPGMGDDDEETEEEKKERERKEKEEKEKKDKP